jgi:hypothetical protein
MKSSSKRSMLAHGVAAAVGFMSFAACSHVAAVHQPFQYLSTRTPIEVWVIRRHNDSVYRILQPRLQGDTLIGFSLPRPGDPITRYQEIPLNDVRQMRARQSSPVRTAALLGGIGGVAYVVYYEFVGGGGSGSPGFCECDFDDFCGCP